MSSEEATIPIVSEHPDDCFGLAGVRLEGRYDVGAVVAVGGFGVVYKATHVTLQKTVALKVLRLEADIPWALRTQMLAKFTQEARTIAQFEHPAVVRILDFGASPMPRGDAAPWMVMEWLSGTTLEEALTTRRLPALSTTEGVLSLLRPVLEALAAAHAEGIVHRDIKPANMMLVPVRGSGPALKILDFGIAKRMEPEPAAPSGRTATRSLMSAFTLPYAAPEQVGGMRTGPWTDVHALGLVLTEILIGHPPYPGSNPAEIHAAVVSPTRPTPAMHGIDAGCWESVLATALARNPAERYQHAGELLAALAAQVPTSYTMPGADEAQTRLWVSGATPNTTLQTAAVATTVFIPPVRAGVGKQLLVGVVAGAIAVLVGMGGWHFAAGDRRTAPLVGAPLSATSQSPPPRLPTVLGPITEVAPEVPQSPLIRVDSTQDAGVIAAPRAIQAPPAGGRRVPVAPALAQPSPRRPHAARDHVPID